jgi:hypothetical protein
VTTEGSTCRTSVGMSPCAGSACALVVLPVLAVVVELVRAEELHPASSTAAITTRIRVQTPRCAADRRCLTRRLGAGFGARALMRFQKATAGTFSSASPHTFMPGARSYSVATNVGYSHSSAMEGRAVSCAFVQANRAVPVYARRLLWARYTITALARKRAT